MTVSSVHIWKNGEVRIAEDELAEEVPVALIYNGISHAVMMASPVALKEFAYGFSLTEGIIENASEIYGVDERRVEQGVELDIRVASRVDSQLRDRRRQMAGRTGCGLCGIESLEQLHRQLRSVRTLEVSDEAIQYAVTSLGEHQPLQKATGAVHGAAWCNVDGQIAYVLEDVGRHNALDKLIGHRLLNPTLTPGFALVSSRGSFEMVQKCIVAGISALVCVSAATERAVGLARNHGLALYGFARSGRHVRYA